MWILFAIRPDFFLLGDSQDQDFFPDLGSVGGGGGEALKMTS